jgi:hypothetical protein
MSPTRRCILKTLAAASALSPWTAFSQSAYPTRPIRVVVPYAAGGGTDFFARLVFAAMSEQLGQQFVIENKPGAGTNIGAETAARGARRLYAPSRRYGDLRDEPHALSQAVLRSVQGFHAHFADRTLCPRAPRQYEQAAGKIRSGTRG